MHCSIHTVLSLITALTASVTQASAIPNVSIVPGFSKRTGSDPFQYRTLQLEFSSGPASYRLDLKADGNIYYTNNPSGVSQVKLTYSYEPPTFDIYLYCNYYFKDGSRASAISLSGDRKGGTIAVGPPQPILGVACRPTSSLENGCLPVYGKSSFCSELVGSMKSSNQNPCGEKAMQRSYADDRNSYMCLEQQSKRNILE